ncbi:MAG: preprotein translocase subunit SecE [Gammaproteobacteria bacterium]
MNLKAQDSRLDPLKWALAIILLAGAVAAYYYFSEHMVLLRVIGILVAAVVSAAIALQTAKGRELAGFMKESQIEVRRVVWPTRDEAMRITLIVIAMVIVAALFLWLLDILVSWLVGLVTGQR